MANMVGFVDNSSQLAHYEFLRILRRFAMGYGTTGTVGYTGTGTGTLTDDDALPAAITETWTITCTVAATDGGTFSVTGSVSGAKADATVGTPYDNGFISFLINDGATDFIAGDSFTFTTAQSTVSANNENWEELRYDTTTDNHELILLGKGLTRAENIYVGFRTYQSATADYYNLSAASMTGYIAEYAFTAQPQFIESGIPAHNQRIDYWVGLNGQKIALALKVGTPVYESAYVGKFLPYARPSQFPHPVVNCGMLSGVPATRFSDTAHSMPYKGNRANMRLRDIQGTWILPYCYPYSNTAVIAGTTTATRDTEGYYHLTPVEIYTPSVNLYGAFDGVYHITGFNNTVENTLTLDGVDYVVIQDTYRTGFPDYYALRLDN